jgi:hypothetical protein
LTRAFLGLDWGGVKAANVANAGVRLQIVLESKRRLPISLSDALIAR